MESNNTIWGRIFRLGVNDQMDFRLAKRIMLSNQFALLIASFTATFMVIFALRSNFNFVPFLMLLATVTSIWFLNFAGYTKFSRLITSLTPAMGLLFMNLSIKFGDSYAIDILHYATPRMLILGSAVLPFTMFTSNEWGYMLTGVTTILLFSFGYDFIHEVAGVDHQSLGIKNDFYGIIYEDMIILAVMILTSSGFMFSLGYQYDQKSQRLLDDALAQTSELKQKEEIMKKTLEELEESRKKDEERNWVSKGLAEMMAILQSGDETQKIFDKLLAYLIRYTGLNQGAFFVADENTSQQTVLKMVACYAYDRKKFEEATIEAGIGLLGQAYLEGTRCYLKKVPADYVRITSGLGEATPSHLVIVPMKINNKVEGLIELASFYPIEEHHFELLEKLGESLASYVGNDRVNARTRTLLQQAQTMSQELRENEEEMRQNLEELTATQEAVARKEKEYQQQIADLQNELMMLKKMPTQVST